MVSSCFSGSHVIGKPIGPNDTTIVGHAIAAGAVLMINNVREFERVPSLVLKDWIK
ncbi:vagD [Enterobacter sp. RHB15-C17]|nr:vagD [Cedecea lapagei]QMM54953.1 vagD [Enterobacter sp. RHB15-C17]